MESNLMSKWIDVGTVSDIPRLGARVVETPRGPIAVFRTGKDHIFALENRCPHKQGPLSEGIVHGTKVTCPLHNWNIELDTGKAVAPDEGCVPPIPVRLEGDRILLDISHAGHLP
jgi:nitrite reductase (NADH) small subunit